MEIETKIFDIKKVRKVLEKNDIDPKRVCDITDFLFDLSCFSMKDWRYTLPKGSKSWLLGIGTISVEIPDTEILMDIRDFSENRYAKGSKIRLRLVDSVPYITIKWPKQTRKGVKSREEIETRIGSLSAMMTLLLLSGAQLTKSIARVREIYVIPRYGDVELVIDKFDSAHGILEYAEIECPSEDILHDVLKKLFKIHPDDISDSGITELHDKKMEKSVSHKIEELEEMIDD